MIELQKDMAPELTLVSKLQELDQRIAALKQEVAELPKRISQIEKTLDQHTRRLEADRAALAANQRDRKKLDSDVQVQQQKVSKLKDQLSEAKTNEQYRAFQSEIAFCEDQVRKYEDKILDLMSASEPLEKNLKTAEENLKIEKQQVEREKKEAQRRTAEDRKQLEQLHAERKRVAAEVTPAVQRAYERIRARLRGAVIVEAVSDTGGIRCSGCQMTLRPQFFQDLRLSGKVMFCETCGRILYYNPPVAVDEQAGPQPATAS